MSNTFEKWISENIKSQIGKTVLITGTNSGIGFFNALAFAKAGAHVIVAGRDPEKIGNAISQIQEQKITGSLEPAIGDMASLKSIHALAHDVQQRHSRLDVLINNAGVMMPPASKTEDGFETQFGVNFLAHFALTGLVCFTKTDLQRHVDPEILQKMEFMEAWQGSLPTLMAATTDGVKQGDYFGPDGPGELAGFPALGVIDAAALDVELATRLWTTAERATGVTFP